MPLKKLHKCNKLGCNNLTRNRYCKEHEYIELEQKRIINIGLMIKSKHSTKQQDGNKQEKQH